jgi:hypothetical protein
MQAFQERLMGFEPTTFCMASRTHASRPAPNNAANKPFSASARARRSARHSPGNHGGFRTQTGPSLVVPKALGVAKPAHKRRPRVPSRSRSRSLQRRSCQSRIAIVSRRRRPTLVGRPERPSGRSVRDARIPATDEYLKQIAATGEPTPGSQGGLGLNVTINASPPRGRAGSCGDGGGGLREAPGLPAQIGPH